MSIQQDGTECEESQTGEQFTVDYFIQKFEAIPEEKWCTEKYINDEGQCCAQGHCGIRPGRQTPNEDGIPECFALKELFGTWDMSVIDVNDGDCKFGDDGHLFNDLPTPKQRILAALKWIKDQIEGEPSND